MPDVVNVKLGGVGLLLVVVPGTPSKTACILNTSDLPNAKSLWSYANPYATPSEFSLWKLIERLRLSCLVFKSGDFLITVYDTNTLAASSEPSELPIGTTKSASPVVGKFEISSG